MSQPAVYVLFRGRLCPDWRQTERAGGLLQTGARGLRLGNDGASDRAYANAQIDDYRGLARAEFPWRPPLRLTLRARFSHECGQLTGTAGFGFWNDPFRMAGLRPPARPQALWFFYAGPHSAIRAALDQPGWGWKASAIDARAGRFLALAPFLALAAPLMRIPFLRRLLWPLGQKAAGVVDRPLPVAMKAWRIYTIDWQCDRVRFLLDGRLLVESRHVPAGPLGLVLWLDNQYLQIAPWGQLRWGLVAKDELQWLEIDWLAVERGSAQGRMAGPAGRKWRDA